MVRSRSVAEPLKVFCASLRELRRAAGQPSLTVLCTAMPRGPAVSTLSDVLNAKITTLPDWGLVAEFVAACVTLARTATPAYPLPMPLADLVVWRRRHTDLERELDAIRRHTAGKAAALSVVTIPRTLPHDVVAFTGREQELAQLAKAVTSAKTADSVGIVAIDGMAGVGKTALAVHAAHRMTGRFPDGQLFVDLHAHTAGQSPVNPVDALHALLSAVGVEQGAIPESLDERAALWRSKLANRRTLLLLDNAIGHEQVKPLLPGAPGACVLITGRRRLAALDGAMLMTLDILSPTEAAELFVRTVGVGDPRSETVHELTRKVGYLPLAIRLLAGRLRSRPTWTVEDLVSELDTARDRSAAIRAENVLVGAVFDLSFNALPEDIKPLFRGLGLHPGVDFDGAAAAALAGVDEEDARRGLEVLYEDHLVEEPVRGRYRLHDLLRDYARGLAPGETSREAQDAMARLLAHYLVTAETADDLLRGRGPAGDSLASRADGKARLDTELPNLIATIELTADGHGVAAARLSHTLRRYLHRHGHWRHAVMLYETASRAARSAADRMIEADALLDLGIFCRLVADYDAAETALHNALVLYDELENRERKARTLAQISAVLRARGLYREAIGNANQSLELFTEIGNRSGISGILSEISSSQCFLGEYSTARETALAALHACHGLGDRVRESSTLRALGVAELNLGLLDAAEETLRNAVRLAREVNYRDGEADALHYLGVIESRSDRFAEAQASLGHALANFIEIGDARGQAAALNDLGILARDQDAQAARRYHILALRIAHSIANPPHEARAWEGIGWALVADGDAEGGMRRLRLSLAIYQRIAEYDRSRLTALIAELEDGGQDEHAR